MLTQKQILKENPSLQHYIVTLAEYKGDIFTIGFDCYAEDACHAEEQAFNAYPSCEIYNITLAEDV